MTPQRESKASDPRIAALDRLGEAVMALAEESRHDREARNRRDRLHLVLLAVVALLVSGLAAVAFQNRQLHGGNAAILASIRDCNTDGGDCYEATEQRTAAYLQGLVAAEFDIAWCVKVSPTRADAQKCVADAQTTRGR